MQWSGWPGLMERWTMGSALQSGYPVDIDNFVAFPACWFSKNQLHGVLFIAARGQHEVEGVKAGPGLSCDIDRLPPMFTATTVPDLNGYAVLKNITHLDSRCESQSA